MTIPEPHRRRGHSSREAATFVSEVGRAGTIVSSPPCASVSLYRLHAATAYGNQLRGRSPAVATLAPPCTPQHVWSRGAASPRLTITLAGGIHLAFVILAICLDTSASCVCRARRRRPVQHCMRPGPRWSHPWQSEHLECLQQSECRQACLLSMSSL